jgi:hypothetical protein
MANFEDRRKLSELIEKATKVRDTSINSISDEALKVLFYIYIFMLQKPMLYILPETQRDFERQQ